MRCVGKHMHCVSKVSLCELEHTDVSTSFIAFNVGASSHTHAGLACFKVQTPQRNCKAALRSSAVTWWVSSAAVFC